VISYIVRPLSTEEYTSVATNLIHDRCSCTLFTLSSVNSGARLFHAWKTSSRGEFCRKSGWRNMIVTSDLDRK